jgi:DNA topoisomerase-1
VAIEAGPLQLEAAGSELAFDGFLRALPERREREATFPPKLDVGQALSLVSVDKRQKFTEPPRRYSEAGLINVLEKEGIGRPSTYASIVSVIQERNYAVKDGSSMRPTLLGHMVVDFLAQYFAETVEPQFTAHLEEDLDRIEEGDMSRQEALDEFYQPFSARLGALEAKIEGSEERPFQVPTDAVCAACGAAMELRYWKGSHFLGCSKYPECRNTVSLAPDLDVVYGAERVEVQAALDKAAESAAPTVPCPRCGLAMELRSGRYGRYYRCSNAECGATASVSTGVLCPQCRQGQLVEKYSAKRRRTFYSCSRYPDCRFATSERPVKECPSCESGVLVEKGGELRCTTKECAYREDLAGGSPSEPEV